MDSLIAWWFDLSNSKSLGLVIFFIGFISVIIYAYGNKKRSKRLETYRDIPFLDDDEEEIEARKKELESSSKKSGK